MNSNPLLKPATSPHPARPWMWLLLATPWMLLGSETMLRADDWPQWLGPKRDAVWRETGILKSIPPAGLKVRWRTKVGGGYAGPAVADGRVFITDRGLSAGATHPTDPFQRGSIPGIERLTCMDAASGKGLWVYATPANYTMSYPAGPRATPVVADGRVYWLGAEGHLCCLEVATGKVAWFKDLPQTYGVKTPLWGFSAHPLVEGNSLICLVGGEGSVVVAFDRINGRELWRSLTAKEPGYCPPVVYEFGGRRQLIVFHPEAVSALDPQTGKVLWSHEVSIRSGLTIPMPRQDGDRLFLTTFYNGSLMLDLSTGEPRTIWQSPKVSEKDTFALHSIMPTPHFVGDFIYGVCSYGQLRCLRKDTGERVWETFAATTGREMRWGNAFLIRHEDRWFLFNEQGELILARLSPDGYEELGRARLLDPTNQDPGRPVVWSHPAFANRSIYARNDREIVCASLADGSLTVSP